MIVRFDPNPSLPDYTGGLIINFAGLGREKKESVSDESAALAPPKEKKRKEERTMGIDTKRDSETGGGYSEETGMLNV